MTSPMIRPTQRPPERVCPDCGGPVPAGHARCNTCKRKAGM